VRLSYHKSKLKLHELFCDHDTVVTFSVVKNNLTGKNYSASYSGITNQFF